MINDVSTRITYRGTGSMLAFPVTFPIYEATDVTVYVSVNGVETKKTLNTDYNVTVNGDGTGGKITFLSASHVPSGCTVAILLSLDYTQDLNLSSVSVIDTESLEQALDRQTQTAQMLREELERAVKMTATDLSTPEQLRDTLLLGKAEVEQLLPSQPAIDRLYQSVSKIDRLYTSVGNIDAVTPHAANIDTIAPHVANVDRVAQSAGNVDTVAADATNVDTVAAHIAQVAAIGEEARRSNLSASGYAASALDSKLAAMSSAGAAASSAEVATTKSDSAARSAATATASAASAQAYRDQAIQIADPSGSAYYARIAVNADGIEDLNTSMDIAEKMLVNQKVISNRFRFGRYLSNGFNDSVTNYARSTYRYRAGEYSISGGRGNSYYIVKYVSDTSGTVFGAKHSDLVPTTVVVDGDFYITYESISSSSDISAINGSLNVVLILGNYGETVTERLTMAESAGDDLKSITYTDKGANRYDGIFVPGSFVYETNGTLGSNPAYCAIEYIDIDNEEKNIVVSATHAIETSAGRYALYDEYKRFVRGSAFTQDGWASDPYVPGMFYDIDTDGCRYIRMSFSKSLFESYNDEIMVSLGSGRKRYSAYVDDKLMVKKTSIQDFPATVHGYSGVSSASVGVSPSRKVASTLSDGQSIELESNSIRKNKQLAFFSKVTQFNAMEVGHGGGAYESCIRIDGVNMYTKIGGRVGSTFSHGLSITNYIGIVISVGTFGDFSVVISTDGGTYSKKFQSGWQGEYGRIFARSYGSNLSDSIITWNSDDYKKPTWLFGDSYFSHYASTRWPYWMLTWAGDNCLLNGYPGEASAAAYAEWTAALSHGTPRYAVWCLGMNDKDKEDSVNYSWVSNVTAFISDCEEREVIPILCTIPNVSNPNYSNTFKNQWVRDSGYRYIDFAKAVDAEQEGSSWSSDYLSPDGVHPSESGARVLCMRALADVPELFQK